MANYIIWTPIWISPDQQRVKMLVALTENSEGIYEDRDFILGLLESVKILSLPTSWEYVWCRSKYFSEYPESDDWRDVWTKICLFQIEFDEKVVMSPSKWDEPWISSNASGGGKLSSLSDTEDANCLVIGDFENLNSIRRFENAIKKAGKNRYTESTFRSSFFDSSFWIMPIDNGYQILFDLGIFSNESYVNGIQKAKDLIAWIHEFGGETHHYHRI